MHTITALKGANDTTLEIGYKRIGRLLALSLEYQGLSSAKAVGLINKIYRNGEGVGKITEGQFGRFVKGTVLRPNFATLCDIATLVYKPSHFLVTLTDPVGQPIIKVNRHDNRDSLIYGTARKAQELPNFESRCSGSDLIEIILDPPLMHDVSGGLKGRTPLFV